MYSDQELCAALLAQHTARIARNRRERRCVRARRTEFEETAKAQNTWMFHWSKPMEAREVARAGHRGMQHGRGVVVPGLLNKLMAYSPGLGPPAIALEINRLLLARRS